MNNRRQFTIFLGELRHVINDVKSDDFFWNMKVKLRLHLQVLLLFEGTQLSKLVPQIKF